MSKELNWPEPVAHLIERHAFRCSPHGQDAEGHDWLEVDEEVGPQAFPVYTAAQVTEMLASLRSELEAARGKVEALTKSTYHMGACITDDTLHATVMRRGPDGMVHVLLSEKVPVDILQNHDVIMGALHPQALTRPAVPTDDELREVFDSLDFSTMVTADDLFYLIARAVLNRFAAAPQPHATDGSPCWCNPEIIKEDGGDVIVHNSADHWQQYAKPGETAQACIERHRGEHDSLMSLLAQARAATAPQPPREVTRPSVPDAKAMANRLMGWKLPKNFSPDCFISFDRAGAEACGAWPVGTNLFTVDQATEMFEYVLAAAPHP